MQRNWYNKETEDSENLSQIVLDSDIPIYNLVSSNQSPLSWREFFVCSLRHARSVPFLDTAWYPHLTLTPSKLWFAMLFYIFHLLPALAVDCFYTFTENPNVVNSKISRVYDKYTSVQKQCEALTVHTVTSQRYQDNNTQALWRTLSIADRTTFDFSVSQLDWDEYLYTLARGVRLYCLGDSLDSIPRAVKRMKKLKLLHYSCVAITSFTIIMIMRALLKFVLF
ncbi:hypothetical protein J6590_056118 [Homalodisca vitripennis]|nr:hypothetical protein J6590_056118 [Homalodisca vitripennis]